MIRPMSLKVSLVLFGAPALLILVVQQLVVPYLDERGTLPLVSFLLLVFPLVLLFVAALVAYRAEGNPWSRAAMAARFRLKPHNAHLVLPGALWVSWIVQRRGNTWIFVISHAALNGLAAIRIVSGIVG
jgi:hypothetical protein